MNRFSILSIIALATIVSSCILGAIGLYDYDESVQILCDNNSDSDVWFSYVSCDSSPKYEVRQFTHEIFWGEEDERNHTQLIVVYGKTVFNQVKENTTDPIFNSVTKNGWKWVKKYCYPDSLRIQVWDDALIQKIGWEEFVLNYDKKYKYKLEYVIDLGHLPKDNPVNFTITYPPIGSEDYMRIVYPQPLE